VCFIVCVCVRVDCLSMAETETAVPMLYEDFRGPTTASALDSQDRGHRLMDAWPAGTDIDHLCEVARRHNIVLPKEFFLMQWDFNEIVRRRGSH